MNTKIAALTLLAMGGMAGSLYAQDCTKPPASTDWQVETIAPSQGWGYDIQVTKDGRVFWVERFGDFKVWDPTSKQVTTIKKLEVLATKPGGYDGEVETGAEGLLLDLNFENTHWVYIWYAVKGSGYTGGKLGPVKRLSRFTLVNGDKEIAPGSEKTIYEHKVFAQCCHYGGAMDWSTDGNIYLSTGDNTDYNNTGTGQARAFNDVAENTDPRNTSSNTNDPRGKILRIKPIAFADAESPTPGIGKTYTIPAGNLKEVWDSPDKSKVLPEIYSMGHRNPFSISVSTKNGWIGVGEANGDNTTYGDDEINVVTAPGNFGWPFLVGDNKTYISDGKFWSGKGLKDPASTADALENTSKWNTGAKILPPATGSIISRSHGKVAMNINCHGVVWGWAEQAYVAGGKVHSYLVDKLLVSGYGNADVKLATLSADGKTVLPLETLFKNDATNDAMRVTQGPDGAFYVSRGAGLSFTPQSACKIYKVSYKGTACLAPIRQDPYAGSSALRKWEAVKASGGRIKLAKLGNTEVTIPSGMVRAQIFDISGKLVWETPAFGAAGSKAVKIPASVPNGMLQVKYLDK